MSDKPQSPEAIALTLYGALASSSDEDRIKELKKFKQCLSAAKGENVLTLDKIS